MEREEEATKNMDTALILYNVQKDSRMVHIVNGKLERIKNNE